MKPGTVNYGRRKSRKSSAEAIQADHVTTTKGRSVAVEKSADLRHILEFSPQDSLTIGCQGEEKDETMMIPNVLRLRSECETVPFTEMGKVEENRFEGNIKSCIFDTIRLRCL